MPLPPGMSAGVQNYLLEVRTNHNRRWVCLAALMGGGGVASKNQTGNSMITKLIDLV